jgi:hypothetical protein
MKNLNTIEALAADIHDATPPDEDGGVPDVCNRYPEHYRIAEALVASGWVKLGSVRLSTLSRSPAAVTVADGPVGMGRGE